MKTKFLLNGILTFFFTSREELALLAVRWSTQKKNSLPVTL